MFWNTLFGPAINLLSRWFDWKRNKDTERQDAELSQKFLDAITALSKALPRTLIGGPDGFVALVPDRKMRDRIETCLIEPQAHYSGTKVKARTLGTEQLRSPMVRQAIQDVLDCLAKLKHERPDIASRLGL